MKKGCFLSIIIFLTILIGSGIYLFKKYGHKLENYGKQKIVDIVTEKLNEKIERLEKSKYNDSLKIFLKSKSEQLKKEDIVKGMNRFQAIVDYIKIIIEDKKVDSIEFNNIKKLALENEKSTNNRN